MSTFAIISRLSPITMSPAWKIGATFLPTRAVGVAMSSFARKCTCKEIKVGVRVRDRDGIQDGGIGKQSNRKGVKNRQWMKKSNSLFTFF